MQSVNVNPHIYPQPTGGEWPGVLPEPAVGVILSKEGRLGMAVLEILVIVIVAVQLWNVRSRSNLRTVKQSGNLAVIASDKIATKCVVRFVSMK